MDGGCCKDDTEAMAACKTLADKLSGEKKSVPGTLILPACAAPRNSEYLRESPK